MFTLLGFKHVCWHVKTFPDVLKSLSEGELLAGIQRYFLASLLSSVFTKQVCFTVYGGGQKVAVEFSFVKSLSSSFSARTDVFIR